MRKEVFEQRAAEMRARLQADRERTTPKLEPRNGAGKNRRLYLIRPARFPDCPASNRTNCWSEFGSRPTRKLYSRRCRRHIHL